MRIRHVRIQSYRGLADVSFPVGDGAILVGKNNAGKSSILEAIGWFFRRNVSEMLRRAGSDFPREDVYTWHEADGVGEELEQFADTDAFPDLARSGEWLEGRVAQDIRITVAFSDVPAMAFALHSLPRQRVPDAATEEPLLVLQRRYSYGLLPAQMTFDSAQCVSRLRVLVEWPENWRDLDASEAFSTDYGAMLPDFVMLDARASDYGEWIQRAIAPLALRALRRRFEAKGVDIDTVEGIITEARSTVAEHVDRVLSEEVRGTATDRETPSVEPGSQFDILGELARPPQIQVPRSLGDGTQRRLLLAALRLYEKEELWGSDDSLVLAIEEPELFLHPTAQRSLAGAIQELRKNGIQALVSTHSATMVDRASLDDVLVVQNRKDILGNGYRRTVTSARGKKNQFEAILRLLGHRTSDVLSTTCAVLVEGPSDAEILAIWATTLGHNLEALGVLFVPCRGSSNMTFYANADLFRQVGVPCVAVLDGDFGNRQSFEIARRLREMGMVDRTDLFVWKDSIEGCFEARTVERVLSLLTDAISPTQLECAAVSTIEAVLYRSASGVAYDKIAHGRQIARAMNPEQIHPDVKAAIERIVLLAGGR